MNFWEFSSFDQVACLPAEAKFSKSFPQMIQNQNEGKASCQAWYICAIPTQFPQNTEFSWDEDIP